MGQTDLLDFVSSADIDRRLQFLRTKDDMDVFWDIETGKKIFMPSQSKA